MAYSSGDAAPFIGSWTLLSYELRLPSGAVDPIEPAELNGLEFIGFDEDLPIPRDVNRCLREHGLYAAASIRGMVV